MKTRLSLLMDGELEEHENKAVFDALKRDANLRGNWQEYLLIGDALKGERSLDADIAASVMDALRDEPVVLAPQASGRTEWRRTVMALAATVAGVAVVGWMALVPDGGQRPVQTLAQKEPLVVQPVRQVSREMQEYLVAHQAQSSSLQFRGGTEHIRTVAATGTAMAK